MTPSAHSIRLTNHRLLTFAFLFPQLICTWRETVRLLPLTMRMIRRCNYLYIVLILKRLLKHPSPLRLWRVHEPSSALSWLPHYWHLGLNTCIIYPNPFTLFYLFFIFNFRSSHLWTTSTKFSFSRATRFIYSKPSTEIIDSRDHVRTARRNWKRYVPLEHPIQTCFFCVS